jgi:hypothetical protein
LHGYSAGAISIDDSSAQWKFWPRVANIRADGTRQIIPDYQFSLEDGQRFLKEDLEIRRTGIQCLTSTLPTPKAVDLNLLVSSDTSSWKKILNSSQYLLRDSSHHLAIRSVAQQTCAAGLMIDRMAWIGTDWGLGVDGFLWSVLKLAKRDLWPTYKIDLDNYVSREAFLISFPERYGCSFAEFSKALASAGPAILLLDQSPSHFEKDSVPIEHDVEALAQMVLDFCPEIAIFMITRGQLRQSTVSSTNLEALDEADTRSYIFNHFDSTGEIKNSRAVSEIFKMSEGLPGKIDKVLKSLRFVSLSELGVATAKNIKEIGSATEEVPRALVKAVKEIFDSTDSEMKRTLLLLKLLCILPYGESLQKIKRFDSQSPFYLRQAEDLFDRDLIDVKVTKNLIHTQERTDESLRVLVARGPVRSYVLSLMNEREIEALTKRAMALYFDDKRSDGTPRLKSRDGIPISDDITTLHNAHVLTLRLLSKSIALEQYDRAKKLLGFSQVYCGALSAGDHYRNCANACSEVLAVIRGESTIFGPEENSLKFMLGKSLRMTREHDDAIAIFEELRKKSWPKTVRVSLLLNYALCLDSMGDPAAVEIAKEVINIAPNSNDAIQAKGIIVENQDLPDSQDLLLKLEREARKKGATTIANNFIISRAKIDSSGQEIKAALQSVIDTSLTRKDLYNAGRAATKLARILLKEDKPIGGSILSHLIRSYQYFYGQRFDGLFLDAHSVLWDYFEKTGEIGNLLSLFRHSSFIWRLNGKEERELSYVNRLVGASQQILNMDLQTADQTTAYFLIRVRKQKNQ